MDRTAWLSVIFIQSQKSCLDLERESQDEKRRQPRTHVLEDTLMISMYHSLKFLLTIDQVGT